MKRIFVLIVFFSTCLLNIHAQQKDTLKITGSVIQPALLNFHEGDLEPEYLYSCQHFNTQSYIFEGNELSLIQDKEKEKSTIFSASYLNFVIPVSLISYGIITRENKSLQELDHSTHKEVSEHLKIPIPIDDYSQFAPAVAVYGLSAVGIKAKHSFRDRAIVMATSYIIMGATVQTMKNTIGVWRPDGSNKKSFPSGHTATAFVGAHILFKEYKDVSPWIGIAGYTIAAGTGVLRILNKKHWVSDVVTGAGVGILSAEIGYLMLPAFHKVIGIKDPDKSLRITPSVIKGNYGLGVVYTF